VVAPSGLICTPVRVVDAADDCGFAECLTFLRTLRELSATEQHWSRRSRRIGAMSALARR
jgi:hypothetical protein